MGSDGSGKSLMIELIKELIGRCESINRRPSQRLMSRLSRQQRRSAFGIEQLESRRMLDNNLQAKVADFGGCSINGSSSSAMGSVRFLRPGRSSASPDIQTDLFALGSTIYEIMTGASPYEDISSSQVKQLYALSQFPILNGVPGEGVIRACWLLQMQSAHEVYDKLQAAYASHHE